MRCWFAGECGGVVEVPTQVQSPQYPTGYPHNLLTAPCLWKVVSSSGDRVACSFLDFDTEANYDVVMLCEGLYCHPTSVLTVLSGAPPPAQYTSLGNSLTLQLTSDGIISGRGFVVSCYSIGQSVTTSTPPVVTFPASFPPTMSTSLPFTEVATTGKDFLLV